MLCAGWQETPVLAENMVTHHWTNTFGHLVAAIVADALHKQVPDTQSP